MSDKRVTISDESMFLKVCAHCGECLRQIVADPDKVNVVLYYQDDNGAYVQWKPTSKVTEEEK